MPNVYWLWIIDNNNQTVENFLKITEYFEEYNRVNQMLWKVLYSGSFVFYTLYFETTEFENCFMFCVEKYPVFLIFLFIYFIRFIFHVNWKKLLCIKYYGKRSTLLLTYIRCIYVYIRWCILCVRFYISHFWQYN